MAVESHYEEKQLNEPIQHQNPWAREKWVYNDPTRPYQEPAQVLLAEKAKASRENSG